MTAGPLQSTVENDADSTFGMKIYSWVATVDHKRVGLLYIFLAVFFLFVGGLEALLMRIQLAYPNNTFLAPQMFNQVFTMHGTTMVFLVGMPVFSGFANYFVPLMIGARDVAFPRLNAMSFWMLPCGAILLYYSFMTGSAPNAGWFSYAPLSTNNYSLGPAIDYWILGLTVMGIGSVAGAINIAVTILCMRAPGMSLQRVPLFVWIMLMQAILIIISLPALNSALAMLLIDRWLGAAFFEPARGGSAVLWQHFFWIFGHPEVYVFALPAFAMISEVIPVFSRKPIYGYIFVAGSSTVILLLGYGVWAHHMFAVGLGIGPDIFFAITTLLIALPTGVKIFNWTATMWGGSIRLTTSMLFAIAFLIQFVIGGLTGVMFAAVPIDWQLTDTYFVVAHFHYVLVGGVIFAVFAATYYWFPKMTGRMLGERLGKIQFWLWVLGFNMTFMVQHFLGVMGMPRRVYTYADHTGWHLLNGISSIGAVFMAVGTLVLVWNIVASLRRGRVAGNNPWSAFTLEWATTSPPPEENFTSLPEIKSRRPVWDADHPELADWKREKTPGDSGRRFNTGKTSAWFFVISEAIFFVLLLVAYVVFNSRGVAAPNASTTLDVSRAGAFGGVLLVGMLTFCLADWCLRLGKRSMFLTLLAATILIGVGYLCGQVWEFSELISQKITVNRNLFSATYFTVTGFHSIHILGGLVALCVMYAWGERGVLTARRAKTFRAIGIYWYFIFVVWIAVYCIVYLGLWQ